MTPRHCLEQAIAAAMDASAAILRVYRDNAPEVTWKADNSPLTRADHDAHEAILTVLRATPYPVLSEEGKNVPFAERQAWPILWIVDPLDGTKEFIKRNDEFTVNIALVRDGCPVLGVIMVPVSGMLYFGTLDMGAFRTKALGPDTLDELLATAERLPRNVPRDKYVIMGSRSHGSPELAAFVEAERSRCGRVTLVPAGSSLKICRVAEGTADVYPRLGPTMEWDTAAGHAIAVAAGKKLTDWKTGRELRYNKKDLRNPWFIVR